MNQFADRVPGGSEGQRGAWLTGTSFRTRAGTPAVGGSGAAPSAATDRDAVLAKGSPVVSRGPWPRRTPAPRPLENSGIAVRGAVRRLGQDRVAATVAAAWEGTAAS